MKARRRRISIRQQVFCEFVEFYAANRCPSAPSNPRRVFCLAERIYQDYAEMSVFQFLSVLYDTLTRLFASFDPERYNGSLVLEDHFVNLLAGRLRINLRRSLKPRTDRG